MASALATAWANQGQLEPIIEKLFRGHEIVSNSRGDSKLVNPSSNQALEIDIWIPSADVCFEFQDDYHYNTTWYSHIPLEKIQLKDNTKRGLLKKRGSSLVLVPFWWDGREKSLIAAIRFVRPDLLPEYIYESNILDIPPLNPPPEEYGFIPEVGQLMPASFPSAQFVSSLSPLNSWWMGEKYDGIRCCWHPTARELYSRSGRTVHYPKEFGPNFGLSFLDGEIWFGRGFFVESQVMWSGDMVTTEWCNFRLVVFDDPLFKSQHLPFEKRYARLLQNTRPDHPVIITASRTLCTSTLRVTEALRDILEDGGEGVILRRPTSLYQPARTSDLIKLKASRGDLEALVTSLNVDNTVSVQLPDGTTFKIQLQKIYPKKGDVVTFSFDSYTVKSVPLNPKISRIRSDMTWEEAIYNFEQQISDVTSANDASKVSNTSSKKPHGFWQSKKGTNMRNVFLNFAKENKMDPFKASSWYGLTIRAFKNYPGLSSILHYFKGSYIRAVSHLLPEIQFDVSKFAIMTQNYWLEPKNRRKFFDGYAKRHGFDPLIPDNWYNISYQSVLDTKGGRSLLAGYRGKSLSRSLIHVYPEIGLNRTKFGFVPRSFWENPKNRRKYMEEFAAKNNFNPLVPEAWYKITTSQILAEPNAPVVLSFQNGKLPETVSELFPELKLDHSKFPALPKMHLEIARHRKRFIKFARHKGFDPLVAENWYPITKVQAMEFEGVDHILSCYGRSFPGTLENLFPEVKFDRRKFVNAIKWHDVNNRRKFFDDFAASKGFDPLQPKNWYSVKRQDLVENSAFGSILTVYGGSLVKALLHNYPEIGFQDSEFPFLPKNHWHDPVNRKRFFDAYAKRKKFDPLVPKNWYRINPQHLRMVKRSVTVLSFTSGNIGSALLSLYPNIGLQQNKLAKLDKVPESALQFFETFARERDFDPLVASNWYNASLATLVMRQKAGAFKATITRRSIVASLISVFPNIGLVHNNFNLRS